MLKARISPKWSKLSQHVLGNPSGIHCHWCVFHKSTIDGEVYCANKSSKYCDGGRIRTWDGEECAKKCSLFKLDNWYTDDKNYEEYFKRC